MAVDTLHLMARQTGDGFSGGAVREEGLRLPVFRFRYSTQGMV